MLSRYPCRMQAGFQIAAVECLEFISGIGFRCLDQRSLGGLFSSRFSIIRSIQELLDILDGWSGNSGFLGSVRILNHRFRSNASKELWPHAFKESMRTILLRAEGIP